METPEHYRQTVIHLERKAANQRRLLNDTEASLATAKKNLNAAIAAQLQKAQDDYYRASRM